jgi:hypothetical protein
MSYRITIGHIPENSGAGVAIGVAAGSLLDLNIWPLWLLGALGCVLSMPVLADVMAQMTCDYRSNIFRRSIT